MRLVKIPNLEYNQYEQIRDAIYSKIPYALLNNEYSKGLRIGYFNFWDVAYIPELLRKYIMQPPVNREDFDQLKQAILKAYPQAETDSTPEEIRT